MKRFKVWSTVLLVFVFGAQGFAQKKAAAQPKFTNADCLACHSDPSMTKDENGKQVSLAVDEKKFTSSIHGQMFQCVDCHTDIKDVPHSTTPAKPACAQCHADQQKKYDVGVHAKALKAGVGQAARCIDCHGGPHEILPPSDPQSKLSRSNLPKTCAACHGRQSVMQNTGFSTQPAISFEESVHGKAIESGSQKAADCADCHRAHDILPASDPNSPIFKHNVPETCSKCHDAQNKEFMQSIHGKALQNGNMHAPACTDCHGIHTIKRPEDPTSSVAAQNLAKNTCARCHDSVRLSDEFGVPGRKATTYLASYHGMANELGSKKAANCASCHGVHNILPSSDPNSSINPKNLVATCGKCHPGANDNFAKAKVHLDTPLAADIGSKASRLVRNFYLLMIFATIGGMLAHNLLVLRKKLRLHRSGHVHVGGGERTVIRMSRLQRAQHLILLSSFMLLVFTGFALKYPESLLGTLFVNEAIRGYLHRIAGVLLIAVGFYHIFYLVRFKEGRKLVTDLLPTYKDATDTRDVLMYYLNLSDTKPQFSRFNYAEKMEYWALVWGTIVMAVTGLMAWFKVPVGNMFPRWTIDVGLTVHFYEAILATLAIVVWHFYMIIFDPDVYPMNWAWYDGKVSLEHYREEHGLDSETILAAIEDQAEAQAEESREPEAVGTSGTRKGKYDA